MLLSAASTLWNDSPHSDFEAIKCWATRKRERVRVSSLIALLIERKEGKVIRLIAKQQQLTATVQWDRRFVRKIYYFNLVVEKNLLKSWVWLFLWKAFFFRRSKLTQFGVERITIYIELNSKASSAPRFELFSNSLKTFFN